MNEGLLGIVRFDVEKRQMGVAVADAAVAAESSAVER